MAALSPADAEPHGSPADVPAPPGVATTEALPEETLPPEELEGILQRCGRDPDALIEVLHQLQQRLGHLSRPALGQVALALALPPSHVLGVASFYHLFRLQPPTPHRCAVCLGTACFVRGAGLAIEALRQRLPQPGWSLEEVGCLGACSRGPVLQIDGVLQGDPPVADREGLARWLSAAGVPQAVALTAPAGPALTAGAQR
ncbi:MAG: NAD(P)H-dependent oxidoreductase subunit E [Synechococcaceae cyanobacterium]|nr:NAD(P)H-dependent oxidoreductase subunit E [Synechococcaceae cyanobacterium]